MYEEPPVYNPPPVYPPPPPVYNDPKVRGAAGLFGDPRFGVFTPGVTVPNALKDFDSGIDAGETVSLLKDNDANGFEVEVTGIQVDPVKTNSVGVGQINVTFGGDDFMTSSEIIITNDGNIQLREGDAIHPSIGNVNTLNGVQDLGDGVTIERGIRNGEERIIIRNGEYEVTAALRSPHPDSENYFDMNFEELTEDAADNATGYQTAVAGQTNPFGIVDLLQIEPA